LQAMLACRQITQTTLIIRIMNNGKGHVASVCNIPGKREVFRGNYIK
jgi:hypothetical protein